MQWLILAVTGCSGVVGTWDLTTIEARVDGAPVEVVDAAAELRVRPGDQGSIELALELADTSIELEMDGSALLNPTGDRFVLDAVGSVSVDNDPRQGNCSLACNVDGNAMQCEGFVGDDVELATFSADFVR